MTYGEKPFDLFELMRLAWMWLEVQRLEIEIRRVTDEQWSLSTRWTRGKS